MLELAATRGARAARGPAVREIFDAKCSSACSDARDVDSVFPHSMLDGNTTETRGRTYGFPDRRGFARDHRLKVEWATPPCGSIAGGGAGRREPLRGRGQGENV